MMIEIRKLIKDMSKNNEWPGELAQTNHILWKFAKWILEDKGQSSAKILALIDKIPKDGGLLNNKLFLANLDILKGLACSDKKNYCFKSAADKYDILLTDFNPTGGNGSWGKQIVDLTVSALQTVPYQTDFVAQTFFLVVGNVSVLVIPFFVKVLPVNGSPKLLFDPISLGVVNFSENTYDNFLKLSVFPAWLWYLHKYKDQAKSFQWGFRHPPQEDALEKPNPSPHILTLTGPSAGGAFAMAFQSAHEHVELDLTVAISVQIKEDTIGKFSYHFVGDLCEKAQVKHISKILYVAKKS